jgi:hypothetical protein
MSKNNPLRTALSPWSWLAELDRNEWLDDGALTDAKKALIEQRFRDLETNLHASVPCMVRVARTMPDAPARWRSRGASHSRW